MYRVLDEIARLCFFRVFLFCVVIEMYLNFIFSIKMSELRPAIIRAHENGRGVCEIARFLGIDHSTVSRTIQRFKETGSNENRKREKTARNRTNIQQVKKMINKNPLTKVNSTRKMAKNGNFELFG